MIQSGYTSAHAMTVQLGICQSMALLHVGTSIVRQLKTRQISGIWKLDWPNNLRLNQNHEKLWPDLIIIFHVGLINILWHGFLVHKHIYWLLQSHLSLRGRDSESFRVPEVCTYFIILLPLRDLMLRPNGPLLTPLNLFYFLCCRGKRIPAKY